MNGATRAIELILVLNTIDADSDVRLSLDSIVQNTCSLEIAVSRLNLSQVTYIKPNIYMRSAVRNSRVC